jgi:drug/metabolite transporter (DMT)-like permease
MSYGRAFALVMVAALLSASNGVFVRWMGEIGDWQLVFWRHAVAGSAMLAVLAVWYRGRLPATVARMGRIGALGCVFFAASGILFMVALRNAPVADVVAVLGAVPPLTALIALIALKERVLPVTWAAMAGAMIGIATMVGGSIGGGNLAGVLLALANALVVAGFAVVLRWGRAIDMLPMIALGALAAAAASAPLAFPSELPDGGQIALLALWCAVVTPLYYSFFVISSRRLPGGELMLSLPVEVIAATLLAWLLLGELPGTASMVGGGIVLASVTGLALVRLRR